MNSKFRFKKYNSLLSWTLSAPYSEFSSLSSAHGRQTVLAEMINRTAAFLSDKIKMAETKDELLTLKQFVLTTKRLTSRIIKIQKRLKQIRFSTL